MTVNLPQFPEQAINKIQIARCDSRMTKVALWNPTTEEGCLAKKRNLDALAAEMKRLKAE